MLFVAGGDRMQREKGEGREAGGESLIGRGWRWAGSA